MNLSVLEPGELACPVCGQRVPNPRQVEEFDSDEIEHVMNGGYIYTVRPDAPLVTRMARCPVCTTTREVAQRIVDEHPEVMKPRGPGYYQLALVETALVALDAFGVMPFMADEFADTDKKLRLLLEYLAPVGGYARFAANFVGTARAGFTTGAHGSGPGICAAGRWQHLSADTKALLSSSYAQLLLARTDGVMDIRPPADGLPGCILCGVATIAILRSKSWNVWGKLYTGLQPGAAGGMNQPEELAGYACLDCREKVDVLGFGPTAVEHAVFDHLGVEIHKELPWVPYLRAWLADAAMGKKPNKKPWEHLGGLEGLREMLENYENGSFNPEPIETIEV